MMYPLGWCLLHFAVDARVCLEPGGVILLRLLGRILAWSPLAPFPRVVFAGIERLPTLSLTKQLFVDFDREENPGTDLAPPKRRRGVADDIQREYRPCSIGRLFDEDHRANLAAVRVSEGTD